MLKSLIKRFNTRRYRWLEEYINDDNTIFVGWMRGTLDDIEYLKSLGVKGPMEYKDGIIEKCVITLAVGDKLKDFEGFMNGDTFTGFNEYGKQISWGGEDFKF